MAGDPWITITANISREAVLLVGVGQLVRVAIVGGSLVPVRAISVGLNPMERVVAENLAFHLRVKTVVALISRSVTGMVLSLAMVRVISPSIRMSTVLSGTLAMIGARGIVLLMAATKAAIVGAIAIGAPKSEVSRDATVLTVATKAAIVRLRTVVNLREPKKVLVPNSARPMGLRVSIVAVWAVLKAWVIELVKARKSVPLPRLRLRVC
jgi:hypothetical protein